MGSMRLRLTWAGIINQVAAQGASDAVGVRLLWAVVCTDADVGWALVGWEFIRVDPGNRIGSCCIVFGTALA